MVSTRLQTAGGRPRSLVFSALDEALAPDQWQRSLWTARESVRDGGGHGVGVEQIDVTRTAPRVIGYGTVGGGASNRFMPSVAVDRIGGMLMTYTLSEPKIFGAGALGVYDERYPTIGAYARIPDAFGSVAADQGAMACQVHIVSSPPRPSCGSQGLISGEGTEVRASNGSWGGNAAVNLGGGCAFTGAGQYVEATKRPRDVHRAPGRRRAHAHRLRPLPLRAVPGRRAADVPGTAGERPAVSRDRRIVSVHIRLGPDDPGGSGILGAPYCTDNGGAKVSMFLSLGQHHMVIGGDGDHLVRCVIADRAGNTTTVGPWTFTLDVSPPTLSVRHAGVPGTSTS